MGITLHAMVETQDREGHWWELSRWELGKDYDTQMLVLDHCERRWPPDVSLDEEERDTFDTGHAWVPIESFPVLGEARRSWLSLEASLVPLAGSAARVIFWTL